MAISQDTSSKAASGTSPLTWTHTMGAAGLLFVNATVGVLIGPTVITSATCDGIAMALDSSITQQTTDGVIQNIYHVENLAAGAHTIAINFVQSLQAVVSAQSVSYTGVYITGFAYIGPSSDHGFSGSLSTTLNQSITRNNSWVILAVSLTGGQSVTPTGDAFEFGSNSNGAWIFDTGGPFSPPHIVGQDAGWSTSSDFVATQWSLAPTGPSYPTQGNFFLVF